MPVWMQYVAAFAALAVLAPAMAWAAKRYGRRFKGGVIMASVLLGFGTVMDPPSKHLIEASEDDQKGAPTAGEPPL